MTRRELKRSPPSKRQYVRTFPASLLARQIPAAKPAPFPKFIEPSLATLRPGPPRGHDWVHEIKYDGYRLQLHIRQADIRLFTRRGYDWTKRFTSIAETAWHLKTYAAVIDGEVIVPTPEGHSDFYALERDLAAARSDRFAYYAFDLLYLDGFDLRGASLIERKDVLAELLADSQEPIRFSEHVEADGAMLFKNACEMELEGIVSKRKDGRYRSGRNENWCKATCRHRETFVVVGWAEKKGRFDGLYLGRSEGGELVYAGKLESGFSDEDKKNLLAIASLLQQLDHFVFGLGMKQAHAKIPDLAIVHSVPPSPCSSMLTQPQSLNSTASLPPVDSMRALSASTSLDSAPAIRFTSASVYS
jgi:bifunctional non-homologous end joining protein LigD